MNQDCLQEVHLKVYSDKECVKKYLNHTKPYQLCTDVDEGGKGHCFGDSGGPLIYNYVKGSRVQIGIVSYHIMPCGKGEYPDVYTKVSHYIDWIKSNTA